MSETLRVVHVTQSDSGGGAAQANHRLHLAMRKAGIDSWMLVGRRTTDDETVVDATGSPYLASVVERLDALPLRGYPRRPARPFSPGWVGYASVASHPLVQQANIVQLGWISGGYLTPRAVAAIGRPMVWRLSDAWAFTGGCHYPAGCSRFEIGCGRCPQLGSGRPRDASRAGWKRKEPAWGEIGLLVAAPSRWLAGLAARSPLLCNARVEVVPTGIDLDTFAPAPRNVARRRLGLPVDGSIVVFGAVDPFTDVRKGFAELRRALAVLRERRPETLCAIFGTDLAPPELPLPAIPLGRVAHGRPLVDVYAAADVVIVPSLEDNLPNVALEAIACGRPVAAFDVGGLPEIIEDGVSGALVPTGDGEELGRRVADLLDHTDLPALGAAARSHAEHRFSMSGQVARYQELYESCISSGGRW